MCFFFFKQKTAYEMRISDWSSDVCSSDLDAPDERKAFMVAEAGMAAILSAAPGNIAGLAAIAIGEPEARDAAATHADTLLPVGADEAYVIFTSGSTGRPKGVRSAEHTSELQYIMRISYAVICLKT